MQKTTNYGLNKPESTEFYNVADNNENMDIVDAKMQEIEETSNDAAESIAEHIADKANPHGVTKEQVGLGNIPNVSTNNQTPTYTVPTDLAELSSGEKLSAALGKIAKAVSSLISHLANKSNPHTVTKTQVGLGNVDDKSSATIRGELTSSNVTTALGFTPAKTTTATTSANGLMSSSDKTKLNGVGTIVSTAPSAVSMGSQSGGTGTAIASLDFPVGVYVVTCAAHFSTYSSSAGSYRRATLSTTSGKIDATRGNSMIAAPINNQTTMVQISTILNVTTAATYYLNAQHNSSESLSVSGQIRAVKIA